MDSYTPLFTKHSREWKDNHYVYPVISRRSKGLSIGVNLNPDKVCNFDCVYCCVDRTNMPGRVVVDIDRLDEELSHMIDLVVSGEIWNAPPFNATPPALRRLNDVAFSGDGEPTSFAKFQVACERAWHHLHGRGAKDARLVVITNATLFHQPRVAAALAWLDGVPSELWCKLDAGTEGYYKTIERTHVPLTRVLDNILLAGRARPIVIQTLFMNLDGVGPDHAEIDAYIGRLSDLISLGCQVKLVQLYTVARRAAESYVTPLKADVLDAIATRVRSATPVAIETYYGPE